MRLFGPPASRRAYPHASTPPVCTVLACAVLTLCAVPAAAQPGPLSGFSFLRLEPSARAAALGGAFSAVYGDDVNALFYNPAVLNPQMHGDFSVSYLNYLSDVNAGFLAYGREVSGVGTVAGGLRFLNWGDLQGADAQGEPTEAFSASDAALTLGAARPFGDHVQVGVSLHAVYARIESFTAAALAADAGVLYHVPDRRLAVSLSLNNAGAALGSFGATRDRLPLDVRLGVSKRLRYVPLLLSVTGYNLHALGDAPDYHREDLSRLGNTVNASLHYITVGGEFQFSEAFNVRFGYNHRRHEEMKMKSRLDPAGVGVGFGLKVSRVRFDYAYNTWSSLGALHQFTVRTKL